MVSFFELTTGARMISRLLAAPAHLVSVRDALGLLFPASKTLHPLGQSRRVTVVQDVHQRPLHEQLAS